MHETQVQDIGEIANSLTEFDHPLIVADREGRWLWVNEATAHLLGRPVAELVGQCGVTLLPGWPQEYPPHTLFKTTYQHPDGSTRSLAVESVGMSIVPSLNVFILYPLPSTGYLKEMSSRTLFNLLPVGVVITDVNGVAVEANPAAMALLGLSDPTDYQLGRNQWQVWDVQGNPIPPEALPAVRAWREHRVLRNHIQKIKTPNGIVRWLSVSATPLSTGGVMVTYADITEQKRLEQRLHHKMNQEHILRKVVQVMDTSLELGKIFQVAAKTISATLKLETFIVQYLPEAKCWQPKVHALPNGDLVPPGANIPEQNNPISEQLKQKQIVQVEDAKTLDDPINRGIAERYPGAWLVVPLIHGKNVWGSLAFIRPPSPWHEEEVTLAQRLSKQLAIAIHRAEMHEQLQASQRHLSFMLANCPASIIHWQLLPGEHCVWEYLSPHTETLLGYPVQTLYERPDRWQQQIFPEDWQSEVLPAWRKLLDGEPQVGIYYRYHHPTGEVRWLHEAITVQCRFNATHLSLISVIVDVTDQKFAELQIGELARLNRLKDDFVSTVSHELRTPLTNIRMATKMLELALKRQDLLPADPEAPLVKYLTILKQETQREIDLVNDLLDLARLEANAACPVGEPVDLRVSLPSLVTPFQERASQQEQTLHLELVEPLPPVWVETTAWTRIINELLTNACKYTPPGEKILVQAFAAEETVQVRVINTGVEIPPTEHQRIFEKFYRIPQHDRWQHGGTGLGLALVKSLVERLGGQITVTSEAGQTCFTLTLRPANQPQTV
ncbi:ATP-binding protein [Synechococcus sp. C9]|uniref:ATP-binding protein n=1 Tax=Synechococcus sp. C9 TaxID=102119 RepID=UPI001FF180AF|nr:ATP-binding protein [Synechococcus sp. C9]